MTDPRITPELPERLFAHLGGGAPVLLLTTGDEGYPSALHTWAVALDQRRVRFGVDRGSSARSNLLRTGKAALQVAGPAGLAFLVRGQATLLREHLVAAGEAAMALGELCVTGAKDQSWPGVRTSALEYLWPEDRRARMLAMEAAIYAEMRAG